MFYSDVILSKRGPLAKVWLAAHAERRLTKSQLLQTDIEQTVSSIIGPDVVPMALRLSGQLLLGVVRIYSRKTRYLLDDCNDALSKLKTAFRTGAIDFTTDTNAAATSGDNVTLPVTRTAFDLGLPDPALEGWDAESSIGGDLPKRSITRSDRYTARPSDITLRRYFEPVEGNGESSGWASGEFFDPDASSGGGDVRPEQLQRRDSQGRLIDENGDLIIGGEERDDDVSSIGIGRDAQMQIGGPRPSLSVVGDLTGFDDLGMEQFLMPEGEGLDLGLEEFDAQRRSMTPVRQTRSSSVMLENLTPRTAIKVQQAAQRRAHAAQRASRKQIIDSRTQLDDSAQNRQYSKGTEGIVLAQPSFLPAKRQHIDLLEIQADPSKGVSPFIQSDSILNSSPGKQTLQSAKDLAPELATLFTFDPSAMLRRRLAMEEDVLQQGPRPQKRTRAEEVGEEEEYASEIGRRAVETGMGGGAELTFDTMDDFDPFGGQQQIEPAELTTMTAAGFDLGEEIIMSQSGGLRRSQRKRKTGFEEEGEDEIDQEVEEERRRKSAFQQRGELERLSTPGEDGSVIGSSIGEDVSPTPSYPLRSFDAPTAGDSSASATGLSRNTLRAVRVLKSQLPHPTEVEDEDEEQTQIELSQITQNASRRAASAFFFELLALGTKDCIGVEQEEPYGEIKIKAKTGLWSLQRSSSVTA